MWVTVVFLYVCLCVCLHIYSNIIMDFSIFHSKRMLVEAGLHANLVLCAASSAKHFHCGEKKDCLSRFGVVAILKCFKATLIMHTCTCVAMCCVYKHVALTLKKVWMLWSSMLYRWFKLVMWLLHEGKNSAQASALVIHVMSSLESQLASIMQMPVLAEYYVISKCYEV